MWRLSSSISFNFCVRIVKVVFKRSFSTWNSSAYLELLELSRPDSDTAGTVLPVLPFFNPKPKPPP